jgi:excisionase family DNA binding protein
MDDPNTLDYQNSRDVAAKLHWSTPGCRMELVTMRHYSNDTLSEPTEGTTEICSELTNARDLLSHGLNGQTLLLTAKDAAIVLRIGRGLVYELVAQKRLPFIQLGLS